MFALECRVGLSHVAPGDGLQELGGVLAAPAVDSINELDAVSDAEIIQIINRLFALCSANDGTVRSALSLSNDASKAAGIKGAQFWRSMGSVEGLARKLAACQIAS